MGSYQDDTLAMLPELDLRASLMLTERLSISLGYHLLFLTDVYRTGSQLDRIVDAGQLAGPLTVNDATIAGRTHPIPLFDSSTLRAQGLSGG
jgi:hypothetical protein